MTQHFIIIKATCQLNKNARMNGRFIDNIF